MRKIIIGLAIFVVIAIAALLIIPSLVPSDVYKNQIETQLSKELGRDVAINGEVSLKTFPLIKAKTSGVRIENPEGFSDAAFLSVETLEARIKLFPLLSKRVEISGFELIRPEISLEKRQDGTANWVLASTETAAEIPTEPQGPFQRDGRFTAIDPQIAAFTLTDGRINYRDDSTNYQAELSDINGFLSLPSLSKQMKMDMAFIYEGERIEIDTTFNSPRAFLDGNEAPLTATLKTDFANVEIDGRFLKSKALDFTGNVKSNVSNFASIQSLSPEVLPYIELLTELSANGEMTFQNNVLSVKESDVQIQGEGLSAAFKGDATLSESPLISGNADISLSNFKALKPYLPEDMPAYTDLLSNLTSSGAITFQNNVLSVNGSDIQINGDGLSASYKGDATLSETPVLSGTANVSVTNFAQLEPFLPEDVPSLNFMKSLTASTLLNGTPNGFKAENIIADMQGDGLSASFTGQADYSTTQTKKADITATGQFIADIADTATAAKIAQVESPYAALLGALSAKGTLSYNDTILSLNNLESAATNGAINGTYNGALTLAETPIATGDFSLNIPDLSVVAKALPEQNAYAQSVKTINASGRVTTSGDTFSLPVLTADLKDGLINGNFQGNGQYSLSKSDALSLQGKLNTTINDLRKLASLGGTELPTDTSTGTIFDAVSLSGDVNGTTETFTLANADIVFDKIRGKGDVKLTLGGQKPFINATLALEGLDLRPYMASYSAQKPTGQIQPWTDSPLNVEPLKAVNADLVFTTPNIVLDRLSLQQANLTATLRDGLFKANMPALSLYGGKGTVDISFDASKTRPTFDMTASLDDIQGNSFLTAIAGFTNATGIAETKLTLSSTGLSQAEIMKGLNGEGLFALASGEIKGIDTAEFLTGLDQAFKSRALPSGIGATKTTAFNEIKGLFSIENGVVTINDFGLSAVGVAAAGGGTIDLGQQNIDFRFRPRLTGSNASNLANFGIPLQFSGGFGTAKPALDTQFLTKIVAERAKAEAVSRVKDQVKGPVGDILGGLLGGDSQSSITQSTGTQSGSTGIQQTETPAQPRTPEQEITNVLGGLFGSKTNEADTAKPQAEKDAEEEKKDKKSDLEKALGGLFGE